MIADICRCLPALCPRVLKILAFKIYRCLRMRKLLYLLSTQFLLTFTHGLWQNNRGLHGPYFKTFWLTKSLFGSAIDLERRYGLFKFGTNFGWSQEHYKREVKGDDRGGGSANPLLRVTFVGIESIFILTHLQPALFKYFLDKWRFTNMFSQYLLVPLNSICHRWDATILLIHSIWLNPSLKVSHYVVLSFSSETYSVIILKVSHRDVLSLPANLSLKVSY